MAELYELKNQEGINYVGYSERGLISLFFFSKLTSENNANLFLKNIQDINGKMIFENDNFSDITIFSELDFGKRYGFGCPDGMVYFLRNEIPTIILIEAKEESYERSTKKGYDENKMVSDGYNSCIKGQIELRWRLAIAYYGNSKSIKNNRISETDKSIQHYKNSNNGIRHLVLEGAVKQLFDSYFKKTKLENIYFLAITKEKNPENPQNPFKNKDYIKPDMFSQAGTKRKVKNPLCWIDTSFLIKEMKK